MLNDAPWGVYYDFLLSLSYAGVLLVPIFKLNAFMLEFLSLKSFADF